MISLIEIDEENFQTVCGLAVAEGQKGYVIFEGAANENCVQ